MQPKDAVFPGLFAESCSTTDTMSSLRGRYDLNQLSTQPDIAQPDFTTCLSGCPTTMLTTTDNVNSVIAALIFSRNKIKTKTRLVTLPDELKMDGWMSGWN